MSNFFLRYRTPNQRPSYTRGIVMSYDDSVSFSDIGEYIYFFIPLYSWCGKILDTADLNLELSIGGDSISDWVTFETDSDGNLLIKVESTMEAMGQYSLSTV